MRIMKNMWNRGSWKSVLEIWTEEIYLRTHVENKRKSLKNTWENQKNHERAHSKKKKKIIEDNADSQWMKPR